MRRAYHITFRKNLPKIRREGLKARGGSGLSPDAKYSKRLFLFLDEADAMNFVEGASAALGEATVVLLEVRLPSGARMYKDPDLSEDRGALGKGGYYTYASIPPKDIVRVVTEYSMAEDRADMGEYVGIEGLGTTEELRALGWPEVRIRIVGAYRLEEEKKKEKEKLEGK